MRRSQYVKSDKKIVFLERTFSLLPGRQAIAFVVTIVVVAIAACRANQTNGGVDAETLRRSFTIGARAGAIVPNFHLIDQDHRAMSMRDLRGKAIALTFIYIRCPLPEFCPFVSKNFAAAARQLRDDPQLRSKVELLSVTIDPDNDTPDSLRAYRDTFVQHDAEAARMWRLATGSRDEIRSMTEFFGLQARPQSGQITHALRTVVIDPRGRITHVDVGNAWKPVGLVAELARAAGN
jgi:protein SCO1